MIKATHVCDWCENEAPSRDGALGPEKPFNWIGIDTEGDSKVACSVPCVVELLNQTRVAGAIDHATGNVIGGGRRVSIGEQT